MNFTCMVALCSLMAGSPAMQGQGQPSADDVYDAILRGRWDEVDRIKEQVGSFRHDKLPGVMDVLSRLASATGYSHVYANVLSGVRICIEYGADPNAMQGSPLSIAAGADKWSKVVERLLQYGADPNLHAPRAPSALHNAIESNLPNNVQLLIAHKAGVNSEAWVMIDVVGDPKNPEFPLKRPLTPLAYAAWLGRSEIVSVLLANGANVNQRNSVTGRTALHEAAAAKLPPRWASYPYSEELQTEVVKALLRHGADKKIRDNEGKTALDLAKKAKAENIVKILEQPEAMIKGTNPPSRAPRHAQESGSNRPRVTSQTVSQAVRWGKWEEVNQLYHELGSFKFPIDPQRDAYDVLTLLALETGDAGTYANVLTGVRICIEYGAEPNAIQGLPLRTAAGMDRWSKVVQRLLQHGADPNLHPDGAETALINAVVANLPENVKLLLEYKADPNQEAWVTVKGNPLPFDRPNLARRRPVTPLILAAQLGRPEIVRILLEGGADVNQADSVYGRTALHEAAVGGSLFRLEPFSKEYAEEAQTETVRILLERGANKEVRDKDGNTALDLARKAKAENVVRILESSARTRAGSLANR